MASAILQTHLNYHSTENLAESRRYPPTGLIKLVRPPSFKDLSFLNWDGQSSSDDEEEEQIEQFVNPAILEVDEGSQYSSEHSSTSHGTVRIVSAYTSSILLHFISIITYYGVGVIFYHYVESWPVSNCIYFTTVSMTTVGYGDVTPNTDGI